jgi:hypothetical protein
LSTINVTLNLMEMPETELEALAGIPWVEKIIMLIVSNEALKTNLEQVTKSLLLNVKKLIDLKLEIGSEDKFLQCSKNQRRLFSEVIILSVIGLDELVTDVESIASILQLFTIVQSIRLSRMTLILTKVVQWIRNTAVDLIFDELEIIERCV